jgi:hypothetical protein
MSSQTDGSDFTGVFTSDFPDLLSTRMSLSQLPIVNLVLRHVYPQTDDPDPPGVSRLEVSRFSCPRESRYVDGWNPDGNPRAALVRSDG